jgi:hypothetical protein
LDAADRTLVSLNAGAGVAAIGGAWYALGGATDWPREWLDGSPFSDYTIPGLVLGGVYAPASLIAAEAVRRCHPRAGEVALGAAAIQVTWIATQLRIIGFRSFLQPTMAAVGLADLALAWRRLRHR